MQGRGSKRWKATPTWPLNGHGLEHGVEPLGAQAAVVDDAHHLLHLQASTNTPDRRARREHQTTTLHAPTPLPRTSLWLHS